MTLEEKFWAKVQKTSGCWVWLAAIDKDTGYGRFSSGGRKAGEQYAHRFSWVLHYGRIPKGLLVCHTCDVRRCVNPSHLYLGTYKDNYEDAKAKDRHTRRGGRFNTFDLLTIRDMISQGMTHQKVADEFGVSRTMISAIARGERYVRKRTV